jgi:hypothetical protein
MFPLDMILKFGKAKEQDGLSTDVVFHCPPYGRAITFHSDFENSAKLSCRLLEEYLGNASSVIQFIVISIFFQSDSLKKYY